MKKTYNTTMTEAVGVALIGVGAGLGLCGMWLTGAIALLFVIWTDIYA
jgi:hypothetical protein